MRPYCFCLLIKMDSSSKAIWISTSILASIAITTELLVIRKVVFVLGNKGLNPILYGVLVRLSAALFTLLLSVLFMAVAYAVNKQWTTGQFKAIKTTSKNLVSTEEGWGKLWGWLVLAGVCGGLTIIAAGYSFKFASNAGIAVSFQQILILVLSLLGSYYFFKETIKNWQQWLGLAFGVVGIVLITFYSKGAKTSTEIV